MTSLLLFAATSLFRFSGGGEQALVDQIAEQFKRTIVMLAAGADPIRSFDFHHDDEKDVQRLLRAKSGFNVTPAGGLFPTAWPVGVGRLLYVEEYQRRFRPFRRKVDFKDGRLTLRTEDKETATLDDLSKLKLSRPLVWPKFYDRVRLRLNVTIVSEKTFYRLSPTRPERSSTKRRPSTV